MREMINQRVPVMTRIERKRLAFLTSTHVVDDLYQGAVDPRRAVRADEIPGPGPSTPASA